MAILPILTAPDKRLKVFCETVKEVDERTLALMRDMLETMYLAPGIGLAAPQVGVAERVIVVDVGKTKEERRPLCMVNPSVVWQSDDFAIYEEGCLSLPEHYAEVERPAKIHVTYIDQNNISQKLKAEGILATCIQHEIDHLDGILFVDHLTAIKKNIILRKLQKSKRFQST